MRKFLLPSLLFLAASSSAADWTIDYSINAGITGGAGGDTAFTFLEVNSGTTTKVRAGGLYYFGLGVDVGQDDWGILVNGAYHFDGTSSNTEDDERAVIRRFAWDLLPYWQFTKSLRVGAGVTAHISPDMMIYDEGEKIDVEFENAFGPTIFVGYNFPESASWIELRYTDMSYEHKNFANPDLDAQHFGLILHWVPSI